MVEQITDIVEDSIMHSSRYQVDSKNQKVVIKGRTSINAMFLL